jgi:DNA-binding NtrC family response regulator
VAGNVRELKNVIERAVIATPNGTITAQCLFLSPGIKTDRRISADVVLPLGTTLDASERGADREDARVLERQQDARGARARGQREDPAQQAAPVAARLMTASA